MCWLKRDVVPRAKANCCVSGVRGAGVVEPALGEVEYSIDRIGGDYRSFETPADPRGKACDAACKADGHCRAWTYLRPGYGTSAAQCFLKDTLKPPRRSPFSSIEWPIPSQVSVSIWTPAPSRAAPATASDS